jgi:hypothetical protein
LELVREREAAVERESSSEYIEARMSVDGSLQENSFCDNHDQDLQQVRDARNAQQEEVSEPSMDDTNMSEQNQEDDDTGVDAPIENLTTDQEDSIIDETLNLITVRDSTRSKSKKLVIPTQYIPFDSDEEQPRPSSFKKSQPRASAPRTGVNAKFLSRNSNQFASTASKKLTGRRGRVGGSKSK